MKLKLQDELLCLNTTQKTNYLKKFLAPFGYSFQNGSGGTRPEHDRHFSKGRRKLWINFATNRFQVFTWEAINGIHGRFVTSSGRLNQLPAWLEEFEKNPDWIEQLGK